MSNNVSKLWKTEDWLAVWIGFIVIAIGMVAVLTKAFDFSALTFKTWTWGEGLTDAQMAKVVPLGQQFAAGVFSSSVRCTTVSYPVRISFMIDIHLESLSSLPSSNDSDSIAVAA